MAGLVVVLLFFRESPARAIAYLVVVLLRSWSPPARAMVCCHLVGNVLQTVVR